MKIFRTEIHGHRIEFRFGDWGGEQVLVNGRIASNRPFAGWNRRSHFLELPDQSGTKRAIEIQRIDVSKLGLGKYRVVVNVDGVERCRLEPLDLRDSPEVCANCGYALKGLPVQNHEVRCPECGRHTSAALLGR